MLALDRRRSPFEGWNVTAIVWTFIFSTLAAINGASLAAGNVDGVGATSLVAILGWVVAYWRAGIVLLIALSCVDGFIKFYHQGTVTLLLKDVTVAAVLVGIASYLAMNPKIWREQKWTGAGLILFYMAFEFIEIFNPGAEKVAAVAGFRAHAFFCVLFFVGALYFKSRATLTRTALIAIGAITFACVMGIVQFALGPAWTELGPGFLAASKHFVTQGTSGLNLVPGASNTIVRAYGTLVDPTALGLAATFGIIYAVGQMVAARTIAARILLASAAFVMFVALLLSGTRAAIAAAAVGFLALVIVLAIRRETRRFVFAALILAVFAVPTGLWLASQETASRFTSHSAQLALETRQRSAALVFKTVAQEPFGVGLGSAGAGGKARQKQRGVTLAVDNLYLATLYETGPLGVTALLVMQFGILFLTWRAALRSRDLGVSATFVAMGAAQVAMLTAGVLNQGSLDYAPMAQLLWLFSGAVTMPRQFEDPPAIVGKAAAPRRVVPLRDLFPRRLRALPGFGFGRRAGVETETVAPPRPISEAEIDAALDRFRAHLRANLTASAALGAFATRDGDELLKLASRKLFMELKKAMAAADADPGSAEKARRVVRESAEVGALMLALSEKYGSQLPPDGT
jgi:hypothetical protein